MADAARAVHADPAMYTTAVEGAKSSEAPERGWAMSATYPTMLSMLAAGCQLNLIVEWRSAEGKQRKEGGTKTTLL